MRATKTCAKLGTTLRQLPPVYGVADVRPLLIPEGFVPERCRELELRLEPMVERTPYRFAFLLPDEIGAHRDFIFGCFRTSVGHVFLWYHNER